MPRPIVGSLALLACLACPLLAHLLVSGGGGGPLRWAVAALPLVALAWWALARSGGRLPLLLALAVLAAAVYWLERRGNLGLVAAYGAPHAAAYLALLWLFGRTLLPGREPLITRVSRRIHGELPPHMEAYTRSVTAAWCVFFGAQVAVSLLLLAFAPLEAWSIFVNLLNVPLLVLMFAGEYACRVIRHPEHPRPSLAQMLRAFARDGAASLGAKAP